MDEDDIYSGLPELQQTSAATSDLVIPSAAADSMELEVPFLGLDIPESASAATGLEVVPEGGGEQLLNVGVQVADQVNIHQDLNIDGGGSFDIRAVEYLVQNLYFGDLESYVESFFPEGETWDAHPWLLLLIRRSCALAFIDKANYQSAANYFEERIREQFQDILQSDPIVVRNANLKDMGDEISFIGSCVDDNTCYPHTYTDGLLPTLLSDYLMLYLPTIRFTTPRKMSHGLWQFALEIDRKGSRPTFRCLVCSIKVCLSETIANIIKHLERECAGPKRTPYLSGRFQETGVHIPPTEAPVPTIRERLAIQDKENQRRRKRARSKAQENTAQEGPAEAVEVPVEGVAQEEPAADVPQEGIEAIVQSMKAEMATAETLYRQMGTVLKNMNGFLTAAQAAAAGRGASEIQQAIDAPIAPADNARTSHPFFVAAADLHAYERAVDDADGFVNTGNE